MHSDDDFNWDDSPKPKAEQVPSVRDDWSDDSIDPTPKADSSTTGEPPHPAFTPTNGERAETPEAVDPRFNIFLKTVPLGVGTCDRWPRKKCLTVGHGQGWHAYVQDVLVEKIPYSLIPGIKDNQGRHVRFYLAREEGYALRFDSPRATTIYLQVRGNNVEQLSAGDYKLALRGRL